MNIREHAQEIIRVYLDAKPTIEADACGSITALELLQQAKGYLEKIAIAIGQVADKDSKKAAILQKQMVDAMGAWASEFANGNFVPRALVSLREAVKVAEQWAKRKGILLLFHKKTTNASEGCYTAEEVFKNKHTPHYDIWVLAEYPKAKEKVEILKQLIDRERFKVQEDFGIVALEKRIDVLHREKECLEQELTSLCGQSQTVEVLTTQLESFEEQIKLKEEQIEDLVSHIRQIEQSRKAEETKLSYLEQTYHILVQNMANKSHLILLASYLDSDILKKMIENIASMEEMTSFVNLKTLIGIAERIRIPEHPYPIPPIFPPKRPFENTPQEENPEGVSSEIPCLSEDI